MHTLHSSVAFDYLTDLVLSRQCLALGRLLQRPQRTNHLADRLVEEGEELGEGRVTRDPVPREGPGASSARHEPRAAGVIAPDRRLHTITDTVTAITAVYTCINLQGATPPMSEKM